jgi:hypothetical protein
VVDVFETTLGSCQVFDTGAEAIYSQQNLAAWHGKK